MTNNMRIYNAVRSVPQEAQKTIRGGRLNGMTDINPMWRIKKLTEIFGPCGIGWWYTIEKQWIERTEGGVVAAFCNILLYYREGDVVSQGIPGTGGSMFIAKEKGGLYVSDECYKMALTDAISVACKALGFGADVYWGSDKNKYDAQQDDPDENTPPENTPDENTPPENSPPAPKIICVRCKEPITPIRYANGVTRTVQQVAEYVKKESGAEMCYACFKRWKNGENI